MVTLIESVLGVFFSSYAGAACLFGTFVLESGMPLACDFCYFSAEIWVRV